AAGAPAPGPTAVRDAALPVRLRQTGASRREPPPAATARRRPRGACRPRDEPAAGGGERRDPRGLAVPPRSIERWTGAAAGGRCRGAGQLRARGLQPAPGSAARRRPRPAGGAAGGDGALDAQRRGVRIRDRADALVQHRLGASRRPSTRGVVPGVESVTVAAAGAVVVSGTRPTGRLHLGHLHGALANWVKLQATHRCFFFVADWHALTTDYASTGGIAEGTLEMVADWLAVGLDPARCTIFQQSAVKEHAELFLLLCMLTPVPWLERNPTYKEQREELSERDLSTIGFLGYPVLQAADILMYKASAVPVGIDQAPHIELPREIARRFHATYAGVF